MIDHLRLAFVGCGGIAEYMALFARLTSGVLVTHACDISPERANAFARKHKIPTVYTDYAEMFATGEFEAVYLAVPHHLHFEMIKAAVDAGIHVFTEKPITLTLNEGRDIVAYAAQKDIKIGVNYQYRYDSGCYRLAHAVQSGELGQVLYARINVPWHRERDYFDSACWHKTLRQAGGGTLITQASHLIDLVLWAVGSPPISAMGYTAQKIFTQVEVEDLALGMVELENGTVLQISSSMIAATEQPVSVEIYAERGTGIYSSNPWPRVKFVGAKPRIERPPQWGFHALHRSLKGFRDWLLKNDPYLIPGEEALPTLQVVEAVYQSAKQGQRVQI